MEVIPSDLIWPIFMNMCQRDLVRVKRTCKNWRLIIKEKVEDTMPMLNVIEILNNAMHLYLGKMEILDKTENNYTTHWVIVAACRSGDKDIIFRWLPPALRFPYEINSELYFCGKEEWIADLGVERNIRASMLGCAKAGRKETFIELRKEICSDFIHPQEYMDFLENVIIISVQHGHSCLIEEISSFEYTCLLTALGMKNDKLIKEIITILNNTDLVNIIICICYAITNKYISKHSVIKSIKYLLNMDMITLPILEEVLQYKLSIHPENLLLIEQRIKQLKVDV